MNKNNSILNRLFTQKAFIELLKENESDLYNTIVERYICNAKTKKNNEIIYEIYKFMSREYRNEYYYQNTLFNKLLLGVHNMNTTTALVQIPIGKSKADFILINGKAVVFEIKTELDTFERLDTQLQDYYKAFDIVYVVTSEKQFERASSILENTPVGIIVLSDSNTISNKKRKKATSYKRQLEHKAIFKLLHKTEVDSLLLDYYGQLPKTSQVFYYDKCFEWFSKIPIIDSYNMTLEQLKKRNKVQAELLDCIPYELKSLIYFWGPSQSSWNDINDFLQRNYGG